MSDLCHHTILGSTFVHQCQRIIGNFKIRFYRKSFFWFVEIDSSDPVRTILTTYGAKPDPYAGPDEDEEVNIFL